MRRRAVSHGQPRYTANYPAMTDQDRIKLLEFKVLTLGVQVRTLVGALEHFLGTGFNKPIPMGLSAAVDAVASIGVTEAAMASAERTAQLGLPTHPRNVSELPDVIE